VQAGGRGAGFFANQFENLANFRAHLEGTGPEIWGQCGGRVDAFVCAAGTGAGPCRSTLSKPVLKVKCLGFST
jgi:cysteine synthase